MKESLILKTKKTLRLAQSPLDLVWQYLPVLGVFFTGLMPLWSIFEIIFLDSYDGARNAEELFSVSWPLLLIGIIIFITQWRGLRMRKVSLFYTEEELNEALQRTIADRKWNVAENKMNIIIANRSTTFYSHWGEEIIIIKLKNALLLNSKSNSIHSSKVPIFGANRKYLKSFLNNLKAVKNGEPAKIIKVESENEWTFSKVIMRIILYPICLFFIALFLYSISLKMETTGKILFLIPAALGVLILFVDIKIIIRDRKIKARDRL